MENSIEEALEKLSTGKKIKMYELLRTFKREGIENFVITRKKYVDVILSDYKRVLKENEELKADNYELNNRISDLLENIPIQKVKEKIEELNKLIIETQKELGSASKEYTIYVYQKNILQELLREE